MTAPAANGNAGAVLITGASAGLGEEMARQLAALGWDLVLCARSVDKLEALASELRTTGRRVEVAALDVTDTDAVFTVVNGAVQTMGRLDRVIVNAGIGLGAPVGSGKPEANLATLQTNVIGAMAQCEAAMAVFREQGHGHLVLIGSVAGVRGMAGAGTAYAASKAAVGAIGEGLRCDQVPGVDVTVLHPGYIRTAINDFGKGAPFAVDVKPGVTQMVRLIEKRVGVAYVPRWPWSVVARVLAAMPLSVVRRITS
ncbi:MAG: NADP-dependent 3-hydroxy acid dehydrogenase YdfG [Myxococcota bacterium]|jgi:NADP-dependent 3-hydroxy acid dehydrogenase YdfG